MGDIENVDPTDECRPDSSGQWRFGDDDDDLEVVVNGSCHGADDCSWDNGAFNTAPDTRMHGARLRAYLGFHGIVYDAPWSPLSYEVFAETSLSNGLGTNWLATMYQNNILANDDQCPVAIVWGASAVDTLAYHQAAGFADRGTSTDTTSKRRTFLDGCDPDEGAPQ